MGSLFRSRLGFTGRPTTAQSGHWWAHLEFTPINIRLTILPKKIEENPQIL
jgi:hypothetical protein